MKAFPFAVIGVVAVSVIAGFFIVGSPNAERVRRFDERRVADLQTIQWEIINYWQKKNQLPGVLSDLRDDIRGFMPPQDPETGVIYEYAATGANSFSLCAIFSVASDPTARGGEGGVMPLPFGTTNDNWAHGIGRACFIRTIDKDLYPPIWMKPMPVIQYND